MKKILMFAVLIGASARAVELVTFDPCAMQNKPAGEIADKIVNYMRKSPKDNIEKKHTVKQFLDTTSEETRDSIKRTLYNYSRHKTYPDIIKQFNAAIYNVKFDPYDDNIVAYVDKSKNLEVWDLDKQKKLPFDPPVKQGVHICSFLNKYMLALQYLKGDDCYFDLEVRDLSSGSLVGCKKWAHNYTMHPAKNDTLVVTDANGRVYEQNLETKEVLGQQRNAYRYSFSPRGNIAILKSKDDINHITLCNASTKERIVELDNVFGKCTFNKAETIACICHSTGFDKCDWYTFWDLKTGRPVIDTVCMPNQYDELAFSPSTNVIAYSDAKGTICLYDLEQKKSLPSLSIIRDKKYDGCILTFNEAGTILSIEKKYDRIFGDLSLVDVKTCWRIFEVDAVTDHALNPSGTILCTCDKDNRFSIWNIAAQKKIKTLFQSPQSNRSMASFITDNLLYIDTPMNKTPSLIFDVEKDGYVKESRTTKDRFLDSSPGISFNDLEISRHLKYIKEGSLEGNKVTIWGLQHPEDLPLEELLDSVKTL